MELGIILFIAAVAVYYWWQHRKVSHDNREIAEFLVQILENYRLLQGKVPREWLLSKEGPTIIVSDDNKPPF